MATRELHSVILNLNKNFSNNKGSDFKTIVNQQLEIKPNTEIALYGGNIVRAPIVLDRDTLLRLKPTSSVPYNNATDEATGRENTLPPQVNFTATLPKGEYSRLGFSKLVARKLNEQIQTDNNFLDSNGIAPLPTNTPGNWATTSFPYRVEYKFDGDSGYYLGLRYYNGVYSKADQYIQDDPYRVGFFELNDNFNTANVGVTFSRAYPQDQTIFTNDTSTADWNGYLLGNSPVRGMAYTNFDDKQAQEQDVGFVSATVRGDPTVTGTARWCFNLSNTLMASNWADKSLGTPAVIGTVAIAGRGGLEAPQGLISTMIESISDGTDYSVQSVAIMINEKLQTVDDTYLSDDAVLLDTQEAQWREICSVDLTQYNIKLEEAFLIKYEVYCRNFEDGIDDNYSNATATANRKYYFKVRIQSPYEQGTSAVIYDSLSDGIVLNKHVVEDGYMFQNVNNPNSDTYQVTPGLCPQYFFYGGAGSFTILNPRCNNIASIFYDNDPNDYNFNIQHACLDYTFEALGEDAQGNRADATNLANVMGLVTQDKWTDQNDTDVDILSNVAFNPNINPHRPAQAGLTVLNSDLTRYNVEINLPVKAFNSTSSQQNDIGQSRTILYNVSPVIEEVGGAQGLINKNIEPNDVKFLSLNNPEKIKLNAIDVKIRRARTNEIADEIQDSSLEILFRKE